MKHSSKSFILFALMFAASTTSIYAQTHQASEASASSSQASLQECTIPGKVIKVACVGNSITAGSRLKNPAQEAYPTVLGRLLGSGYEVKNFGYSGRTMLNKGDRPYMKETMYQDALQFNPAIVIIKLGTNDSKPQNWQYKEEFVQDMKTMVSSFQSLESHPKIYVCLPVPPVDGGRYGITDSIVYNEVIPMIEKAALEMDVPIIDLYTALKPYPELFEDQVHPNRAGACIMAEEVSKRLLLDAVVEKCGNVESKSANDESSEYKDKDTKVKYKRHKKSWK